MAVPVRTELLAQAGGLAHRLEEAARRAIETRRAELRSAARALPSAEGLLGPGRQRLDLAAARLVPALRANARGGERRLHVAGAALAQHAPRATLAAARLRLTKLGADLDARWQAVLQAERVRIARGRDRIADLDGRAMRAIGAGFDRREQALKGQGALLQSLGYRSVLARGYALVRDEAGRPVPRAAEVRPGQPLSVEFADGARRVEAVRDDSEASRPQRPRRREPPALAQDTLFDM